MHCWSGKKSPFLFFDLTLLPYLSWKTNTSSHGKLTAIYIFNFFQIINAMMPPRYMKHVCCIESISKIQSHLVCKADGEIKWMSNILKTVHFNASLYLEIYWLIRNQTKCLRNDIITSWFRAWSYKGKSFKHMSLLCKGLFFPAVTMPREPVCGVPG